MDKQTSPETDFNQSSDEELAALCQKGIDLAEQALLRRHMQAIYWLPQRVFGAPEEELCDFLLFAVEKIRARETLARYDSAKGATFSTWFGVVIRRLYLDYRRSLQEELPVVELVENSLPAPEPETGGNKSALLEAMEVRCRVLFKLLLGSAQSLSPEEREWMTQTSGRSVLELAAVIAEMEERLRDQETTLKERYDKLAAVFWWKTHYEKQVRRMEKTLARPWTEKNQELEKSYDKLAQRQAAYERMVGELAGHAGLPTVPYREIAQALNLNEGTLASHISRCRTGAATLVKEEA
jgi:RNA polymerase sigma factor (sigma-70 family)